MLCFTSKKIKEAESHSSVRSIQKQFFRSQLILIISLALILGFAETFKALSDPVRRQIFVLLKDGKKSAGDIAKEFDMTQATVSYHLSQLKKAKLIIESKYKNFVFYEINISVFEEVMLWLSQFGGKDHEENQ